MRYIGYYHLYLTDDPIIWTSIFIEQMQCIQYSGLGDKLECLNIRCISKEDSRLKMLCDLMKMYPMPFNIDYKPTIYRNDYHTLINYGSPEIYDSGQTESITLKGLYDASQDTDAYILYFHSKAISSYLDKVSPGYIQDHKLNLDTRHLLNWGVLERWRDCVAALEEYDTAGISYTNNTLAFYAGNFWWARSSHIRRLLDPVSDRWHDVWGQLNGIFDNRYHRRCGDEMWLCSHPHTKSYDILQNLVINENESMPPYVRHERFPH